MATDRWESDEHGCVHMVQPQSGSTDHRATVLLAVFPVNSNNDGAHWAFIISTWFFNFWFSCTMGPLSWIYPAEIFDTEIRSRGVSASTMMSFAFNTMIGQVTPIAMERIGWRFFILFCVGNFINVT